MCVCYWQCGEKGEHITHTTYYTLISALTLSLSLITYTIMLHRGLYFMLQDCFSQCPYSMYRAHTHTLIHSHTGNYPLVRSHHVVEEDLLVYSKTNNSTYSHSLHVSPSLYLVPTGEYSPHLQLYHNQIWYGTSKLKECGFCGGMTSTYIGNVVPLHVG